MTEADARSNRDAAVEQLIAYCGGLEPGTRLPALRELAELVDVSRTTLGDHVLPELVRRGVVVSAGRHGWYTPTDGPEDELPRELRPGWQALAEQLAPRVAALAPGERPPSAVQVAGELGVSARMIRDFVWPALAREGLLVKGPNGRWRRPGVPQARQDLPPRAAAPQRSQPRADAKWPGVLERMREHVEGLQPGTPLGPVSALAKQYGLNADSLLTKVLWQLQREQLIVERVVKQRARAWFTAGTAPSGT